MSEADPVERSKAGGSVITIAIIVMNLGTYGFNIVAARLLGPQEFGAVASLLNLLILVTVLQLALQTVSARRIAAQPSSVAEVEDSMLRVGWRAALAMFLLCLVVSPLVNVGLRLESLPTALLTAVIAVPFTMTGVYAGILQGERRWGELAAMYAALGIPRLLLGVAMILVRPTQFSAMVGVTVAAFAPAVIGWLALRRGRAGHHVHSGDHHPMAVIRETISNGSALLAFLALANVDLLIARNIFDEHTAGLYAAGSLLIKAVLFLPQFVVVLAFPSMGTDHERRDALVKSLLVVIALGVIATAATWLLSGLALTFVGGPEYAEIESRLWAFAALGTAVSLLQILVYSVIARQGSRSIHLVWAALVAVAVLGRMADDVAGLLVTVAAVDCVLLVLLLGISWHLLRKPVPVEATA